MSIYLMRTTRLQCLASRYRIVAMVPPKIILLIVVVLFGMLQYGFAQGSQTDYQTQLRTKAEQGDVEAQFKLGYMYAKGQGVTQNYGEAVKWYRQAAEQGDPDAQSGLGAMYDLGEGVPKDSAQAVNWFRKAAEQGHATAQNNLGVAYRDGLGVSKDLAQAVQWFRKAAEQGLTMAQNNLATIAPGLVSGRLFAITKGGDIKPARFGRVYLFNEDAAFTFMTEHIKQMDAFIADAKKHPASTTCEGQWNEYVEALSATVNWAKNNGKMAQLSQVDTDEEGNFKIAAFPGKSYYIMADGHAGLIWRFGKVVSSR